MRIVTTKIAIKGVTNDVLIWPPKFLLIPGRRCKDRCREGTDILGAAVKIRGTARPRGAPEAVEKSVGRGDDKRKAIAIFGSDGGAAC